MSAEPSVNSGLSPDIFVSPSSVIGTDDDTLLDDDLLETVEKLYQDIMGKPLETLSPQAYDKLLSEQGFSYTDSACHGKFGYYQPGATANRGAKRHSPREDLWDPNQGVTELVNFLSLKSLNIPHTPQLHHAYKDENNRLTLVIDHMGVSVFRTTPSLKKLAFLTKDWLSALAGLHAKGWGHFDVNPKNLTSDPDKGGSLIDLGTVSFLKEKIESQHICSPNYRPFEVWLDCHTQESQTLIDVFSLGCSLYELTAGRPFLPPSGEDTLQIGVLKARLLFSQQDLAFLHQQKNGAHTLYNEEDNTYQLKHISQEELAYCNTVEIVPAICYHQETTTYSLKSPYNTPFDTALREKMKARADIQSQWIEPWIDFIGKLLTPFPTNRLSSEAALKELSVFLEQLN